MGNSPSGQRNASLKAEARKGVRRALSSMKKDSSLAGPPILPTPNPVSLFDRLPSELVAEIFIYVVAKPQYKLHGLKATFNETEDLTFEVSPRLPASICRRWRLISLSTPELWESIIVRFRKPLRHREERSLLKDWLKRSGARPICLDMSKPLYKNDAKINLTPRRQKVIEDLLEIVASQLHRCKVLYLGHDGSLDFNRLAGFFAKGMPHLTDLFITTRLLEGIDLKACPQLQTLGDFRFHRLHQFAFDENHARTLRCLKLEGSVNDLFRILVNFPSVRELSFISMMLDSGNLDEADPPEPILELPNLEHLDVLFLRRVSPALDRSLPPWNRISLPSLKSMKVSCGWSLPSDYDRFWSPLLSCLRRSQPSLEALSLLMAVPIMHSQDICRTLSLLPTLKRLEIKTTNSAVATIPCFWHAFYGGVGPYSQDQDHSNVPPHNCLVDAPICPRLEYLVVQTNSYSRHGLKEIAGLTLSRFGPHPGDGMPSQGECEASCQWNNLCTLREMKASWCAFTVEDFLEYPGIDKLVQSGLVVSRNTDKYHQRLERTMLTITRKPM